MVVTLNGNFLDISVTNKLLQFPIHKPFPIFTYSRAYWFRVVRESHFHDFLMFTVKEIQQPYSQRAWLRVERPQIGGRLWLGHHVVFCSNSSTIPKRTALGELRSINPLHPNISMHLLSTVLHTFPDVLTRRICLTTEKFFSWWSFPIFSWL